MKLNLVSVAATSRLGQMLACKCLGPDMTRVVEALDRFCKEDVAKYPENVTTDNKNNNNNNSNSKSNSVPLFKYSFFNKRTLQGIMLDVAARISVLFQERLLSAALCAQLTEHLWTVAEELLGLCFIHARNPAAFRSRRAGADALADADADVDACSAGAESAMSGVSSCASVCSCVHNNINNNNNNNEEKVIDAGLLSCPSCSASSSPSSSTSTSTSSSPSSSSSSSSLFTELQVALSQFNTTVRAALLSAEQPTNDVDQTFAWLSDAARLQRLFASPKHERVVRDLHTALKTMLM